MRISILSSIVLLFLATNCKNDSSNSEGTPDYETAEFTYLPNVGAERIKLCDVKYYVNEDTLFSSEKYHTLYVGYSTERDGKLSYVYSIFFDTKQKPNDKGWYYITLSDAEIPRIPFTYLSSIRLRNYFGPLNQKFEGSWPDAVLFNMCPEIANGQDRNTLTPELTKLLPYLK